MYSVNILDANGCNSFGSAYLNDVLEIELTAEINNINCIGDNTGYIDLSVNYGIQPYSFIWSNGESSEDLFNLTNGVYGLTIYDMNNCQIDTNFLVTENNFTISSLVNNVSCHDGSNGNILIDVNGDGEPYSYLWNDGSTFNYIQDIQSNEYSVLITDKNDCDTTLYFEITEPNEELILNITENSCGFFEWNGQIYFDSGIYYYETVSVLGCDSTVILNLTVDICGCTDTSANNYNSNATMDDESCSYCDLDVNLISQNPSSNDPNICYDGWFTMTPNGTPPYNYSIEWNNNTSNENYLTNACNDIYNIIIVTDANNCQFDSILILSNYIGCTDSEAMNYDETALFDDNSCIDIVYGCMDELADNYDPNANIDDESCIYNNYGCMDVSADNYNESANIDDGSCIYCEIQISSPPIFNPNTSLDYNGYILIGITSTHNPVSIQWDNGMNGGFLNGLCSGDYNYTATDAQGCELTGTVTVTGTVEGCTDPTACNYQAVADIDDGSCVYLEDINVTLNTNESGHTVLTWDSLQNVSIYKVYKGTSLDNVSLIGSSFEPYFLDASFNNHSYYYQVSSTIECLGVTNEVFSNPVLFNYTSEFSVDVVVNDASCLCCNDGSVNFTISGGFPPYDISEMNNQYDLQVGQEITLFITPASGAPFFETYIIGYEEETYGCMDELAINYDECVTTDDGSCEYENLSACDITPSGLFVDDIIHERVRFNWSAPASAPSYYMIRYKPVGTNGWTVMRAGPETANPFNGTSENRYFMEPGTTYQWNIRARNIDENGVTICQSPWSVNSEYTTLPACANLENLSVSTEAN